MPTNIIVPALGESVVEATIARWIKKEGDTVQVGEALVELETDKVDLEIPAEQAGVLTKIERGEGEDVQIGDVIGMLEASGSSGAAPKAEPEAETAAATAESAEESAPEKSHDGPDATPVAKRMASDQNVDLAAISGSGSGGRITKQDVEDHMQNAAQTSEKSGGSSAPQATAAATSTATPPVASTASSTAPASGTAPGGDQEGDPRGETRVKMSRRRRTIAERLVYAQQTAAMLTTFNDIDMSAVMEMRARRKEQFLEQNGVKLGYTSFFVKASIGALRAFPQINAEIQETDIVLKHYYDIGVAVGAEEGLVVPVLRDADRMSFAGIEKTVKELVGKSRDGSLSIADLMGGTFTITNGGVFGSMLSTPILNPPQVAILGLHRIEERPVVVKNSNGEKEISIRPMMYVALSYDHRIVDGREAVQFLVKLKELIEDPEELMLAG